MEMLRKYRLVAGKSHAIDRNKGKEKDKLYIASDSN